jgi:predicted nucleic acid-binding protein
MSDRVFIDTNILVYVDDLAAGSKRERARAVLAPVVRQRRAVISTQVLQEYFAAAMRKLRLSAERARWRVEVLSRFDVVMIRPELVLGAIDLHRLHRVSFWDALVVKCASAAGCATVLTEDMNHGQTIDGVRIENPFLPAGRVVETRARYAAVPAKRKPRRATRR